MTKKTPSPTKPPVERAFLVGVDWEGNEKLLGLQDSLEELSRLTQTAGLDVVGEITQRLIHPNPETFLGSGKVKELKVLADETLADVIIFDHELSPRHQRELESIIGSHVRIIDRTALILDIFAQHATTREGMLQVELAQYEYYLPRLTGAWTHLARQAGGGAGRSGTVGGVGLRGPGETQLEVDRRQIRKKISTLKKELEKVKAHRQRYRNQRRQSRIPVIALVGYTNSGKSTLLNRLADADVLVADQLFATLDPTTRKLKLKGGYHALMTDTVGFIQNLPTTLVEAFQATLEEIAEADLLVHVIDISHPHVSSQARSVINTLQEINANHIPILTALNKADKLHDLNDTNHLLNSFQNSIVVSALTGYGMQELVVMIQKLLYENMIAITVRLPYTQGQLISLFHESGRIDMIEQDRTDVFIQGRLPGRLIAQYHPWIVKAKKTQPASS